MGGVHWHSRVGSPKKPQGQGFIAAASMKRDGKVIAARAMVTLPSSSGWRMTSRTLRWNSGSSSREQYAIVSEGDFAGARESTPTNEACIADGVVRRTKRT